MKGIILAGGNATRLYPITKGVCKQMLPVYDKPLIYYPLSTLMLAGIKDILIISTPKDTPRFKDLLGDGKDIGINISYAVQDEPKGIADAFIVGEDFIKDDNVCLILGDNIFYGHGLTELLEQSLKDVVFQGGSIVFGYWVKDPERYAVVELAKDNKILSIEEKPKNPKSKYVVPGIYFCDNKAVKIAKNLKPSERGEIEITDLINEYYKKEKLKIELMGRGYAWLDTGIHQTLLEAGNFVATIEHRQGLKVACIEEIAYCKGYIDKEQLSGLAKHLKNTCYGEYLENLIVE
ncbi:MAG: glucose-1-phosphate thymidylyltransferase RfbA [Candidatus Omnitrophica bacterium]|nr:glucose-1-phosphate thymidylyltransferase RfbA [Candidatus Omnitrophota bacterium]